LDRAGKPFFPENSGYSVVGAPGRAPDRPASFCGNTIGSLDGILFPPMLFPRNGLASGPQSGFLPKKGIAKVKEGQRAAGIGE